MLETPLKPMDQAVEELATYLAIHHAIMNLKMNWPNCTVKNQRLCLLPVS